MLTPITSVTHAHLAYVLAAESKASSSSPIRLLDAGCGNGELLVALHRHLPALTGRPVEVHGFDVSDARVQRSDFFSTAMSRLGEVAPDIDWSTRLHQVRSTDEWPFDQNTFDFVVSNQVLEHVSDLSHFLVNVHRVLKVGGTSVNLFPMRSSLVETHVGAPLVHRIKSDDVRERVLARFAQLRLSRKGPMRQAATQSPDDFGRTRSEYVATQTFYRSFSEIARFAHQAGLTASYRWTPQFYTTKLGYITGRDTSGLYRRTAASVPVEALTFPGLSTVSSVTVCLTKSLAYDPDAEHAGHLS